RMDEQTQVIASMPLDGSAPIEMMGANTTMMHPQSWSQDGRVLVTTIEGNRTRMDVELLPLDGRGQPTVLLNSEAREDSPAISPDGKWIAYTSDEAGQNEVYIRANP